MKDAHVATDIIQQKYDLIIYGSYHRGLAGLDLVNKYYPPHKIVLLCGEDLHSCNYEQFSSKGYHVFVREL
jgi:hypothetical protein